MEQDDTRLSFFFQKLHKSSELSSLKEEVGLAHEHCNQFELASGAKVNRGKSEAMFFGNWAVMDHVHRYTMYKALDRRGKNVPNTVLILMATFMCSCIKLKELTSTDCCRLAHSKVEYEVLFLQFACGVIVTLEEAQDGHVTKGVGGGVKIVGNRKVVLIKAYREQMLHDLATETTLGLTDVEETTMGVTDTVDQ
eukprot:g43222.t1